MRRITEKQLESRIKVINSYTNNKYNIKLQRMLDYYLIVNGKEINEKQWNGKQVMEYLDKTFNDEIRKIVIEMNKENQ